MTQLFFRTLESQLQSQSLLQLRVDASMQRVSTEPSGFMRRETWQGKEFLVVPVVALVEGVLHSANAEHAELALAEEFGKFPSAWDGRPVVLGHPKRNGIYVSANRRDVFEREAVGVLFNTRLSDKKLKTEAWIDVAALEAKAKEDEVAAHLIEDLNNGRMIEVSTGLFSQVRNESGSLNGKEFRGVWEGVVPDHLALLSRDQKGACSIENGCGAPRLNQNIGNDLTVKVKLEPEAKANAGDCGCGCGGAGTCKLGNEDSNMPDDDAKLNAKNAKNAGGDGGNGGETKVNNEQKKTPSEKVVALVDGLIANEAVALGKEHRDWLLTLEEGQLQAMTPKVAVNSSENKSTTNNSQQLPLSAVSQNPNEMKPNSQTVVTDNVPQKPVTLEQYLSQAPMELRETLESGIRMHNQRRTDLIKGIKANSNNKFSDDELNGMAVSMLERLASLAATPHIRGNGQSTGVTNYALNAGGVVKEAADDDAIPPPPRVNWAETVKSRH